MTKTILTTKETLIQLEKIRLLTAKDAQMALTKIHTNIDWELFAGTIADKLSKYQIKYNSSNIVFVIKSLALEILFDIPNDKLHSEITDRKSYQQFLGVHSNLEIPENSLCLEVKNTLLETGLYTNMISLLDAVLEENYGKKIQKKSDSNLESKLNTFEEKLKKIRDNDYSDDKLDSIDLSISKKLKENNQEISNITRRNYDAGHEKSKAMNEKLKDINEKIDNLFKTQILKENTESDKITDTTISKKDELKADLPGADKSKPESNDELSSMNKEKDVYKRMFDSFYNQLQVASKNVENKKPEIHANKVNQSIDAVKDDTTEKLKRIEDEIKKLYERINGRDISEPTVSYISPNTTVTQVEKKIEQSSVTETKKETTTINKIEDKKVSLPDSSKTVEEKPVEEESPIIDLRKKKRYHIFNNINLTEDYELGIRFYKLGFKTAFINMRADEKDENSRIATAEYFPNSFWGSVKQRSRWIAGIVFQNWKIHKWEGNLKTKYFLLRDRKALFSFFGIFLSNVVFAYFLYYMLGLIFNFEVPEPNVEKGTLLWYLMVATLFFLISRIVHRFASTYNWYGFKYAALSIVRLIFDNLINLFATIRAIKVYNTNKKQIVWDSTDHY